MEKRADRSIDALAALCDFGVDARLVVLGEGPMRAKLQRQAARLPIDFTGFISNRHTVAGLLASADVTLARGRTKHSGWPRWNRWRAAHRPWSRGRRR